MALVERFKNAFNAFRERDPTDFNYSTTYSYRVDQPRLKAENLRSMVSSVYNWIATDVSNINVVHVKLDDDKRFSDIIDDSLNTVLNKDANIDQTGRSLIRDTVLTMLDEGYVAVVPVLTDTDPLYTDSYKILELRVGSILDWSPNQVKVNVYDQNTGKKRQIVLPKRIVAIIENPFYTIMNEPNSTAQRLKRTLSQMDRANAEASSDKLNMVIQLPYSVRSKTQKAKAEERIADIEDQLTKSPHGIAYTDATEKIVQLNRPLANDLWEQAKDLKNELFSQLGFTESIFNGTADEKTMLNYNNRTIEPILSAITEEMERKWLSKTAQSQGQAIRFYEDPFKLVPVAELAEIVDKLTRNEVTTSNEIRSIMGLKPSKDPKADMLINSNLKHQSDTVKRQDEEGDSDMRSD